MSPEGTIAAIAITVVLAGVLAALAVSAWRDNERGLAVFYGTAGLAVPALYAYAMFFRPLTN